MSEISDFIKSCVPSFVPEEEFAAVFRSAASEIRKLSNITTEEVDRGTFITCWKRSFFVDKIENKVYYCNQTKDLTDNNHTHFRFYNFFNQPNWVHVIRGLVEDVLTSKIKEHVKDENIAKKFIDRKSISEQDRKKIAKTRAILHKTATLRKFNLNIHLKILSSKIRKLIDPEVMKIAFKIKGPYYSSLDLSLIGGNLNDIRQIMQSNPAIVALWLAYKQIFLFRETFFQEYRTFPLVLNNVTYRSESIIQDVKQIHNIFNIKKYWKYLCKMSLSAIRPICLRKYPIELKIDLLSELADTQEIPRPKIVNQLAHVYSDYGPLRIYLNETSRIGFLRQLIRAGRDSKNLNKFYESQSSLVFDWIRFERPQLDRNQADAPWSWYMQKQEEWHEQRRRMNVLAPLRRWGQIDIVGGGYYQGNREDRENLTRVWTNKWESLVDKLDVDEYSVISLTTTDDLEKEGSILDHCVGSYNRYCEMGNSRIFSILKGDKHVSTLEIKKIYGGDNAKVPVQWRISQIRGYKNDTVTEKEQEVARKVLEAYTKKEREIFKEKNKEKEIEQEDLLSTCV